MTEQEFRTIKVGDFIELLTVKFERVGDVRRVTWASKGGGITLQKNNGLNRCTVSNWHRVAWPEKDFVMQEFEPPQFSSYRKEVNFLGSGWTFYVTPSGKFAFWVHKSGKVLDSTRNQKF